jgi:uncharacterized membrane protein YdjX (TVP38/TMEM64 family)
MGALLWLALVVVVATGLKLLRFGPESVREVLMNVQSWAPSVVYLVAIMVVIKLLASFMTRIFTQENREWKRVVGWLERGMHGSAGSTRQTRQGRSG